ncbi:MAG: peptidylprolyl isomerase [Geodermatophilaceae bacterium]
MATNKQRREAARRQLQRQLERRAEEARKRRRNTLVGVAAFTVVVLVLGVLFLSGAFDDNSADPTAQPEASSEPEAAACTYAPGNPQNPNLKDVGVPPEPDGSSTPVVLDVVSTQGPFQMTLDPTTAPCAANSMKYLAENAFFDGSPCHRLVNSEVFGVLQCGDPTGTGSGGPSYSYLAEPDSVAALAPSPDGSSAIYPRGSVAMAQGGGDPATGQPATIGSQFFICFQDTQLPPDYTLVGTITSGIEVIDAVAAGGNDGSFEATAGGGAPLIPITLTTVTVAAPVA